MWKPRWLDLGIVVVALLLVCGASRGWAQQQPAQASTQGQGTSEASSGSQGTSLSVTEAQQQVELARLRTEVARLQQQLTQMSAQLAQARSAQAAVPAGSGTPPSEPAVGGSGSGSGSVGTGSLPGTGGEGIAEVGILYTGRVRSVTPEQLVLEDTGGGVSTLSLAKGVRVFENGRTVARDQLTEGRRVRTTADLATKGHPVTRVDLLPER